MKPALLAIVLFPQFAAAGLEKYSRFIVADAGASRGEGVRVTYLGVNGYEFQTGGHALLVDPYFSRVGLMQVALNRRLRPDQARIGQGLQHVQPRVDAVLVTHGHFDHLLDVPEIACRTGAQLVTGETAANLAISAGFNRERCLVVQSGMTRTIAPWKITVLAATHDHLFGRVPFAGTRREATAAPAKPSDWLVGEPLAFVIEAAGRKIYIDSGGTSQQLPPREIAPVDLAILGVALADSRKRLPVAVDRLHARYVLPSHQDDFLSPVERGFSFGRLTNFPEIVRLFEQRDLTAHLVLLEYFSPWTIP